MTANPYTTRPVTHEEYFIASRGGRGAQAYRLLQQLCRVQPPPDSVSVVGDRRSGKTSLLGFLKKGVEANRQFVVVDIDMLTLPEQTSDGFYTMLTRALVRRRELPVGTARIDYLDFVDFLHSLADTGRWMFLFIDEMDVVTRDRRFNVDFFDNLRSCATTLPLTLVVASVAPLSSVAHSGLYGSPFFNIFNLEQLGPLSSEEVSSLIKQPPKATSGVNQAFDEIVSLAGSHPFLLQRACACAWDILNDGSALDLENLRNTFELAVRDHLRYVWEHCSKDEKRVLVGLAKGQQSTGPALTSLIARGYCRDETPPRIASSVFNAAVFDRSEEVSTKRIESGGQHTFISYSHKDRKWLDELLSMLAPLLNKNSIAVWDDAKIKTGAHWDDEIHTALAQAHVAILLVSDNFFASEYIIEHELPAILSVAERKDLSILWVLIAPCLYEETELQKLQAAHDPARPLSSLPRPQRKAALLSICKAIQKASGNSRAE